jgi:hypothetical protein
VVRRLPCPWLTTNTCIDRYETGVVVYGHAVRGDICAIAITDEEYPDRVALALCRKIANEFTAKYPRTAYANAKVGGPHMSFPELKGYLDKYQRPEEADNIAKIQKELDETKATVLQTLESLLERGEKIENLVAKSEGLSVQSKMFFSQVRTLLVSLNNFWLLTTCSRLRSRTHAAMSCEYDIERVDCCTGVTFGFVFIGVT